MLQLLLLNDKGIRDPISRILAPDFIATEYTEDTEKKLINRLNSVNSVANYYLVAVRELFDEISGRYAIILLCLSILKL